MPALTERSAVDLAAAIQAPKAHRQRGGRSSYRTARAGEPAAERRRRGSFRAGARGGARRRPADRKLALRSAGFDELPPLLGVPFTVKESIALEGMPNTAGVVARREYRASRTATAVKRLVDAGAIPLGVTNTSELTLWIESENRLYGRTNNPYDWSRTAGGSSGGEGAAVGSGGSAFGIGGDIGGSIRIPALFCGVFGHKPRPA